MEKLSTRIRDSQLVTFPGKERNNKTQALTQELTLNQERLKQMAKMHKQMNEAKPDERIKAKFVRPTSKNNRVSSGNQQSRLRIQSGKRKDIFLSRNFDLDDQTQDRTKIAMKT